MSDIVMLSRWWDTIVNEISSNCGGYNVGLFHVIASSSSSFFCLIHPRLRTYKRLIYWDLYA